MLRDSEKDDILSLPSSDNSVGKEDFLIKKGDRVVLDLVGMRAFFYLYGWSCFNLIQYHLWFSQWPWDLSKPEIILPWTMAFERELWKENVNHKGPRCWGGFRKFINQHLEWIYWVLDWTENLRRSQIRESRSGCIPYPSDKRMGDRACQRPRRDRHRVERKNSVIPQLRDYFGLWQGSTKVSQKKHIIAWVLVIDSISEHYCCSSTWL